MLRARQPQLVHRLRADQQRMRRVEAAGDADHELLDAGRTQPLAPAPAPGCCRPRRSARRGAPDRPARTGSARRRARAAARPRAAAAAGTATRAEARRPRRVALRRLRRRCSAACARASSRSRSTSAMMQLRLVGEALRLGQQRRRSRRSAPGRPRPGRWSTRPARPREYR